MDRTTTIPVRDHGEDDNTILLTPDVSDADPDSQTVLEIVEGEDGGVELHAPAVHGDKDEAADERWGENLALRMSDGDLCDIAAEVLDGVDQDERSRAKFLGTLTAGLDLLGLELEDPGDESSDGGISRLHHPVLTEAIVKAQSNAIAELLPSGGPVKVKVRGGDTRVDDQLALALERDMNWYLTTGAPEFYPDMHRGLFGLFFSGNLFKKVYRHPLRRRPVSESVSVDDLIVSQEATDLETAIRVTHLGKCSLPMVKRMMWRGGWRDVDLGMPMPNQGGKVAAKASNIMGLGGSSPRPYDTPFTILETLTDIDLAEYGITHRGQPDGLPIPVRVTVDKDSQQVLAVHRAWRRGDTEFQRHTRLVHYGMIPALGFLNLGYVHLLGNQAKALTAIWRILVDAGMFSNMPGGVKVKGLKTATNEIRPGPGEWIDADIGERDDIRKALMAMPYKDPSAVFIQLAELIGQDAQRLGGAIEFDVGEGRSNVPVGTMLAMVEQATQVTAAVHKRLHAAQARELELLKECFSEDPESLWRLNPDPARQWRTAAEFGRLNLIPSSDPNVPAQVHRTMIALAMVTMAAQNPDIYDRVDAHTRAWNMIGVDDTSFIHQAAPQSPDQGAGMAAQAALQKAQLDNQTKMAALAQKGEENQRKAANEALDAQQRDKEMVVEGQQHAAELASQERIAGVREQTERLRLAVEEQRAHREMANQAQQAEAQRQHDMQTRAVDQGHEMRMTAADQEHSATKGQSKK